MDYVTRGPVSAVLDSRAFFVFGFVSCVAVAWLSRAETWNGPGERHGKVRTTFSHPYLVVLEPEEQLLPPGKGLSTRPAQTFIAPRVQDWAGKKFAN